MSTEDDRTSQENPDYYAFGLIPVEKSFFSEDKTTYPYGTENVQVRWMKTLEKGRKDEVNFSGNGYDFIGSVHTLEENGLIYKLRSFKQHTPEGKTFLIYGLEKTGDKHGKQEYEVKFDQNDPEGFWVLDNSGKDSSQPNNPFEGVQIHYVYPDKLHPSKKHIIFFLTPEEYEKGYKPKREEKAERQGKPRRYPYNLKRY